MKTQEGSGDNKFCTNKNLSVSSITRCPNWINVLKLKIKWQIYNYNTSEKWMMNLAQYWRDVVIDIDLTINIHSLTWIPMFVDTLNNNLISIHKFRVKQKPLECKVQKRRLLNLYIWKNKTNVLLTSSNIVCIRRAHEQLRL